MYGALLLFESEFVHIVAISFTSLILTELLMVALTIQTWHWLMTVAELLSLACYIASLVFLHEFIGETPAPNPPAWEACLSPPEVSQLEKEGSPWHWGPRLRVQQALALDCPTDGCPVSVRQLSGQCASAIWAGRLGRVSAERASFWNWMC